MSEPVPPLTADPARHTPEARARAIAALLATGLVRLGSSLRRPTPPPPAPEKNVSESLPNPLAEGPDKSVTVTAG